MKFITIDDGDYRRFSILDNENQNIMYAEIVILCIEKK